MRVSRLPLYLIFGFNMFTLVMYVISPYVFKKEGFVVSVVFVFVNIVALAFGYLHGERLAKRQVFKGKLNYFRRRNLLFLCLTIFYTATFLIKYGYLLKFPVFDVVGMIQHLMVGVISPKIGYLLSVDDTRRATVSWSLYFFTNIFNGVYFIIGFLLWKKLSRFIRFVFLFFVVIEVFYWVGRGTNFGIIALLITFLLASVVESKGKINYSLIFRYAFLFAICLISFSAIMYSRSGGAVEDFQVFSLPQSYVDESSILFDLVHVDLHTSMLTVFFYLVQGYYNMFLAFDLDFSTSWFGGWNPSIQSLYSTFGVEVTNNTYVQRLEALDVDPRVNWHSAYTWYANDVSFYGVPVVIYGIGILIGFSWVRSVVFTDDLISKLVFVLMAGSSLFFFANNNFIAYHFYSMLFLVPYWLTRNMSFK